MIKQICCMYCKELKWMRHPFIKNNLVKFNVSSIEELNKKYVCSICRKKLNKYFYVSELKSTKQYKKVQKLLQEEVKSYENRGLSDQSARINFINNVRSILDKFYIKDYNFIIINNKLAGIEIVDNVPFFGKTMIELESKG